MGNGPGEEELRRLLTQHLADMCGLRPDEVDPDRSLGEHGLSSRDAVALAGYLETLLDRPLPPSSIPPVSHAAGVAACHGGANPALRLLTREWTCVLCCWAARWLYNSVQD